MFVYHKLQTMIGATAMNKTKNAIPNSKTNLL